MSSAVSEVSVIDPFTGDSYQVEWQYTQHLNPDFQHYIIERSTYPSSAFVQLTTTSFRYYLDTDVQRQHNVTYYYRIKPVVTNLTTIYSTPVSWNANSKLFLNHNIIQARIMDLQWIQNKGGFSQLVKLVKRKHAGVVCTHGSISRRGRSRRGGGRQTYGQNPPQDCTICFGTGFEGGYEKFIGTLNISRTNPAALDMLIRDEGQKKQRNEEWWMLGYPIIEDGDIMAIQDNRRYRVSDRTVSDPVNGFRIWQGFNLIEIQDDSIEFQVSV